MSMLPKRLGLFQKRISGDDALLELAQLRFQQFGLGAELYPETPEELEALFRFDPQTIPRAAAHLPRDIDLLDSTDRKRVVEFARRGGQHLFGLVVHDQAEAEIRFGDYVGALRDLDKRLGEVNSSPGVFIEYAALLAPTIFRSIFEAIADLDRVSACVDIGHVGLRQARLTYLKKHTAFDVCGLTPTDPSLPELIEDVQAAVGSGLGTVLSLIKALCALKKPLHFHLHDAHPLSTLSPFGVSDHLSFLEHLPIPFAHQGRKSVELMFGLEGLAQVIETAMRHLEVEKLSFSLEIHPTTGRLPLRDAGYLFEHWQDETNAEKMNAWLATLGKNHRLLEQACSRAAARRRAQTPR